MTAAPVILEALVLFLFAAGVASFAALLKGCRVLRRLARGSSCYDGPYLLRSSLVPGVSILTVPANASAQWRGLVRRLLDLEFGNFELVLVLNGPSEADMDTWTREFHLNLIVRGAPEDLPTAGIRGVYESVGAFRLVVVDKEPGGEADGLNAGVNVASFPVVAVVDLEAEFELALLLRLIVPMLEDPERTVAVCGAGPSRPSARQSGMFGALESLRSWMVRCAGSPDFDLAMAVPGSAVLVRRDTILEVGGFRAGPLELLARLRGMIRHKGKAWRIRCVPENVNRTSTPDSLAALHERTRRDQFELARLIRMHGGYPGGIRALGWGLPALLCERFVRPVVETAAYLLAIAGWLLGLVDGTLVGLVLLTTAGMGIVISMAAVTLREIANLRGSDPALLARLFFAAIPENLGYRQVRNLWLIAGFFSRSPEKQNRGRTAEGRRPAVSATAASK